MTGWLLGAIGVLALGNGLSIWLLVRASRKNGSLRQELEQVKGALDVSEKMHHADGPRDVDDTSERMRQGEF